MSKELIKEIKSQIQLVRQDHESKAVACANRIWNELLIPTCQKHGLECSIDHNDDTVYFVDVATKKQIEYLCDHPACSEITPILDLLFHKIGAGALAIDCLP